MNSFSDSHPLRFLPSELGSMDLPSALVRRLVHHVAWCREKNVSHEFFFVYQSREESLVSRLVQIEAKAGETFIRIEPEAAHPPQNGLMLLVDHLADRIPEGILVATFSSEQGDDTLITYANQTLVDLLGTAKTSLMGEPESNILRRVDDAIVGDAWRHAIQDRADMSMEASIRCDDGRELLASIERKIVRDVTGWCAHVVLVFRDMDSEIKLQEQQEKQRKLSERMQVLAKMGWWEMDVETGELSFSKGIYPLFDEPEGSKPSLNQLANKISDLDRSRVREMISTTLEQISDASAEVRISAADKQRWQRLQSFPGLVDDGVLRTIMGTIIDITDLMESEQQRQYQHQELEFYLSCLDEHALLLKLDRHYRIAYANQKFYEAFKMEREDLVSKPLSWLETRPGSEPARHLPIYEAVLQSDEVWRGELMGYGSVGNLVNLEVTMSLNPGRGQASDEIYVVAYDITQRKQLEAVSLAVAELRRLRLPEAELIQRALEQLITTSGSGSGVLQADNISLHWPSSLSPTFIERQAETSLQFQIQFQDEVPGVLMVFEKPGGYDANDRELLQPLVDLIIQVERDRRISDADRQLQSENRFILETLKIGSWRRELAGKNWSFSKSLYAVLEYPPRVTVPMDLWDQRVPVSEQEKLQAALRAMVETGESCETTIVVELPNNRQKHLKIQGRMLRNAEGHPQEVLGIASDVTDEIVTRRELENQKSLASHQARLASIGELASGVGHEINNPLTIIRGFIEIIKHELSGGQPDLDEINDLMAKMDDSAGRIEKIVKGLRSLSHVDAATTESFAPGGILRDTVSFVDEIYRRQGVELQTSINVPESVRIMGHEGKLQQVLMNLLSNARDATERQSARNITASSFIEGSSLIIVVQDNGPGVGADIRERIFDPFFTTKEIGKGTGIGLSMVYGIVQEFEGEVQCLTSPSGGAEFRVALPLQSDLAVKISPETTHDVSESKMAGTILLVEDEQGVRDFLQLMLEQLGLSVVAVENGLQAIDKVNATGDQYDLVITDLTMPEMSGLELVEQLQSRRQATPNILLTTGRPDFSFDANRYPAVVGLLAKPFNLKSIRSKLEELNLSGR